MSMLMPIFLTTAMMTHVDAHANISALFLTVCAYGCVYTCTVHLLYSTVVS